MKKNNCFFIKQTKNYLILLQRFFISIILILQSFSLLSQSTLYREWYNGNYDYLKITCKKSTINSYHFDKTIIKKQNNSTLLTFINYYWKAGSLKRYKEICQFEIIKHSDDTLILSAMNELSRRYLQNRGNVIFTPHLLLGNSDPNFHFQKLIFKYSPSLALTRYTYEIDSVGNIIYSIENFNDKKSYSGTLKSKEFNKLIDLLSRYNLSNYNLGVTSIDGNYYFIEAEHNNIVSKMETMRYFSKADNINVLLDFLLNLKNFIQ